MLNTQTDLLQNREKPRICLVVPTYDNLPFLPGVLAALQNACLQYGLRAYVVDDGSTDGTGACLDRALQGPAANNWLRVLSHSPNRGKVYALRQGFRRAFQDGYTYAVTLDSDGQHRTEDLPHFLEAARQAGGAPLLCVGARAAKTQTHKPLKNTLANALSDFWFRVQTLQHLPDTQCGYRLYPLREMQRMKPLFGRYAGELEWLVRAAWRGIPLRPLPVEVVYPPQGERITHFKPLDFIKISVLNTLLCLGAFVFCYPRALWLLLTRKTHTPSKPR